MEYTSYDFKPQSGLGDQLVQYVLSKEYVIKKLWKKLPVTQKGPKKRLLALRILSHLRDHEKLTAENLTSLNRGTRLRGQDREEVVALLRAHKLIRKIRGSNAYTRRRRLYG